MHENVYCCLYFRKKCPKYLRLLTLKAYWHATVIYDCTLGNNWGIGAQMADFATEDCLNTPNGKLGCGPQETFRGCADICIGPK